MDTRPRTSLISFCTVQLRTLCAAHSLVTLCLFTTSGPDPGELLGFWGSMVFRHAPIPRKGSGKQQQQQQQHDIVNNRIADIANDILSQLIAQIQDSPPIINLQFDKTTDIESISRLAAYVRFVKENAIVDEFLFCQEMKERTRAKDVFDLVNAFLRENSVAWNKVGSVCTDGDPAMMGHRT